MTSLGVSPIPSPKSPKPGNISSQQISPASTRPIINKKFKPNYTSKYAQLSKDAKFKVAFNIN